MASAVSSRVPSSCTLSGIEGKKEHQHMHLGRHNQSIIDMPLWAFLSLAFLSTFYDDDDDDDDEDLLPN